ncbi:hypothetical protein WN48_03383 [Eufriesea mexicana]|uniref:C2H2-type domain-containing protein n=1 Tax=Eufriesea mexicana TaxID=516756 RepID=A0A310SJJ2_9HYME|nr:hypothetical protein WN48_03383 [Eufriesea mexicana]
MPSSSTTLGSCENYRANVDDTTLVSCANDENGHMLTHRNKKPYECKAEGCGKSYCDARSLRRHTENHHAGSKVNESVSPSSPTTGPHTPNTPGSNPSTPSTPGATSTPNGHGHPALKQLLATEPTQAQQQKKRARSTKAAKGKVNHKGKGWSSAAAPPERGALGLALSFVWLSLCVGQPLVIR